MDNIRLQTGGRTGDIIPLDVSRLQSSSDSYAIVGWDLLSATGGSPLPLSIVENTLRGDHALQIGSDTVGFVLFGDRINTGGSPAGQEFYSSGQLYLAPPTTDIPGGFDADSAAGFQGEMRLWYRSGSRIGSVGSVNYAATLAVLDSAQTDAQKLAQLNSALIGESTGTAAPQLPTGSTFETREIDLGSGDTLTQWIVDDSATDTQWVVVDQNGTLSLYLAAQVSLAVVPGSATIEDAERVVTQAATTFEVAQLQQRLRYWNYPGDTGELVSVDGIVSLATRHAAGLFTASVTGQAFATRESLSGSSHEYVNAVNGPRWTELIDDSADFDLATGPFPWGSDRFYATDWLIETIRDGSTLAKNGGNPISMDVIVRAMSADNGPGQNFTFDGFDAGLAVEFELPGTPDVAEVALLVVALESAAYEGVAPARGQNVQLGHRCRDQCRSLDSVGRGRSSRQRESARCHCSSRSLLRRAVARRDHRRGCQQRAAKRARLAQRPGNRGT